MLGETPLARVRDRLLLFRSLEAVEGLDDDGYALLAEHSRARFFRRGASILEPGRPVETLYVATSGRLAIERATRVVQDVTTPVGLGFLSFYARSARGESVVALAPTHTLELPGGVMLGALETNFSLLRSSLRLMARRRLELRKGLPATRAHASEARSGRSLPRPHTLVERILEIHRGVLFRSCNLDAVIEACRQMRPVRWGAGEPVWERGDPASTWVRVLEGRVHCEADAGRSVEIGAGFALGVDDALGGTHRSFSATAATEVHGLEMDVDAFLLLLAGHFDLAREMLAILARDLLQLEAEAAGG
ncbi:MAG: cyclic nucleotide-binding domain-containing protein [Deltaproteobacteria bacterium]|nr:cyclic nucleotide-binding domain-containing protein [Deltaproteobacteria bacterium]